jgi:hypothetical protein
MKWIDRLPWILAAAVMLWFLALAPLVQAEAITVRNMAGNIGEKVSDPDWLSRKALKYGFLVTICATNTLRMANEADEYDSRDLISSDTKHLVDIGIVTGCVLLGWELYAIMERDTWTWKDKVELIGGGLSLCREFGEFTYQGMRHGDPFNNNPDWHRSELLGIATKPTFPWLRDDMIATGRVGTPVLHIGLTGVGAYLLGGVR